MEIPIYTTANEPEDYKQFSIVFGSMWKAFDVGELSTEKLLLLLVLYRKVNAFNGKGQISYVEICILLRRSPTLQNINGVNKLMAALKKAKFIWFPRHSGSREFPYVIAKFKLAKNHESDSDRWIDIEPYFQNEEQNKGRGNEKATTESPPDQKPRQPPPKQRLEGSNGGSIPHISEGLEERLRRGSQTETHTDTQTN